MPIQERKYNIKVTDLDIEQIKIIIQTPNKDIEEFTLTKLEEVFGKPEQKCAHIHGGLTHSCQRQCQRPVGHKGNHYYAWGKAGREKWAEEREKSNHE
jgi:hypothetical protein